jgi:hypothetical protein
VLLYGHRPEKTESAEDIVISELQAAIEVSHMSKYDGLYLWHGKRR